MWVPVIVLIIIGILEIVYARWVIVIRSYLLEGKIFVEVVSDKKVYGWVKRNSYLNIVNGKMIDYNFLELEKGNRTELVLNSSIKRIKEVRSVIKVIMGSLK